MVLINCSAFQSRLGAVKIVAAAKTPKVAVVIVEPIVLLVMVFIFLSPNKVFNNRLCLLFFVTACHN
jgi:hypothetical protein